MKSGTNGVSRGQRAKSVKVEGPNWILIAGGALLSTLSIRLGYKLKQTLDSRKQTNTNNSLKGNGKSSDRRRVGGCHMHSNMYSFTQDDDGCFNCMLGMSVLYIKRLSIEEQVVEIMPFLCDLATGHFMILLLSPIIGYLQEIPSFQGGRGPACGQGDYDDITISNR